MMGYARIRYAPEFVQVAGLGAAGDVMDILFGKPQSWYTAINQIQKDLAILLAEVTAIDSSNWNATSGELSKVGAAAAVGLPYFYDHSWTTKEITQRIQSIIVTDNHVPSDSDIAFAKQRLGEIRSQVEFVKKVAPELQPQIAADRAKAEGLLSNSQLLSPADAGKEAFVKSLEEQAGKLGQFGMGIGLVAAAAAALYLFGGRKSNPAKNDSTALILIGGAAAALLLGGKKTTTSSLTTLSKATDEMNQILDLYRTKKMDAEDAGKLMSNLEQSLIALKATGTVDPAQIDLLITRVSGQRKGFQAV